MLICGGRLVVCRYVLGPSDIGVRNETARHAAEILAMGSTTQLAWNIGQRLLIRYFMSIP